MFLKVAQTLKGINFVLVGSGYLKSKLIRMAKDAKNIKFVGIVDDDELRKIYASSHVICLPSINTTEAYGLVLIEGALHGCVPLASNLLGVRENVSQLKGLTFKTGSCVDLGQKISMLANDEKLWTKLAKESQRAASDYAKVYNQKYYVTEHEKIFTGNL